MGTLKKYMSTDKSVSFGFLDATDAVNESLEKQGCLPPAGIHLGQALMACALIKSIYGNKAPQKLRMQWSVSGGFGNMFVDTSSAGGVRGTIAKPTHFAGQLKESLGEGILQVIREGKKNHTGMVDSQGDVCVDSLEYLHKSEQRSCAMNLWVQYDKTSQDLRIKSAIGYIFEILPISDPVKKDAIVTFWEEKFKELGSLSQWSIDYKKPIESMVQSTLGPFGEETESQPIFFECTCSQERAARALAIANQKQDASQHQDEAEVVCEYCGQRYDVNLEQ